MPPKILTSVVLICTLLAFACGPLVPLSYVKGDVTNQLLQTIETEEAIVSLEYINSESGHYVFDLEIINLSGTTMPAIPQMISFYASPNSFKPIQKTTDNAYEVSVSNSSLTMGRQFANSPNAVRKIYYEKVKSSRAAVGIFAIIGIGLTIYDAAKDSEDNRKEKWSEQDEVKATGRDLIVSAAYTAVDISKFVADKSINDSYYIPYELFPECTIGTGMGVRGKIFIPIEVSYRYSRVVVPFGYTDYVFDFKRRGVKTTQSQSQHHLLTDDQHK